MLPRGAEHVVDFVATYERLTRQPSEQWELREKLEKLAKQMDVAAFMLATETLIERDDFFEFEPTISLRFSNPVLIAFNMKANALWRSKYLRDSTARAHDRG